MYIALRACIMKKEKLKAAIHKLCVKLIVSLWVVLHR